jgi:hypothetical protein
MAIFNSASPTIAVATLSIRCEASWAEPDATWNKPGYLTVYKKSRGFSSTAYQNGMLQYAKETEAEVRRQNPLELSGVLRKGQKRKARH